LRKRKEGKEENGGRRKQKAKMNRQMAKGEGGRAV
jgi:hypothetical protein